MKLKKECVRDVLKYLENNLQYNSSIFAHEIKLQKYSSEDILYTCEKLYEAGFLNIKIQKYISDEVPLIMILSITYEGHQFLDNIRDDGVWKHTKNILSKFSSVSLTLVSKIAAEVITQLIEKQMGI